LLYARPALHKPCLFMSRGRRFSKGWATFGEYLTGNEASPTNHCWCQKTRVVAVSCGIKISAMHHLVLSQYTLLTDRRTDGRNCDSNTVRCITCSRTVKVENCTKVKKDYHENRLMLVIVCVFFVCVWPRTF